MIPLTFIDELLSRVDIVDVVGRHVQLKKGGVNLMGLCPFHGEKSPSFSVSPTKQFYHCFGCGANGNAIRFLTEFTGASFPEAVRELAQQVGLQVPQDDVSPAERERFAKQKERQATLTDVLAKAAEHFRKQLKSSPRAIAYLKGRGLSGEIAAQFGLGYAPDGWRGLANVFPSYDDPLLEESGLVIHRPAENEDDPHPAHSAAALRLDAEADLYRRQVVPAPNAGPAEAGSHPLGGSADAPGARGAPPAPSAGPPQAGTHPLGGSADVPGGRGAPPAPSAGPPQAGAFPLGGSADVPGGRGAPSAKRYDRFRDRIMFPIRSVQGEIIGFGGRVLDRGEPKYLNSPETAVFSKGRELYGLHEARSALRQRGYALVVEGYMDVVALAQSGFGNAVATLGTACTAEHVQKLFRFTDSVVFSFDGDSAGRRAAGRALEASLPHATDTRSLRFLFLPAEHDPDSFVREHGAAAFERCVETAVPLSRQLCEMAADGQDLGTAEGRAHMLATARPMWSALPDGALKRQMLGELATLGRLETGELQAMWRGAGAGRLDGAGRADDATRAAARPAPSRRARGVNKGTANLLDRAVWLLLHRSDLWTQLDGETHDTLAAQATPYDQLFGAVERSVHDHGALAPAALLAELQRLVESPEAAAAIVRIAAFHEPDPQADFAQELRLIVDRLHLQSVEDELKSLFESGALSPDAQQRGKRLMATQSRLKAELARAQSLQGL